MAMSQAYGITIEQMEGHQPSAQPQIDISVDVNVASNRPTLPIPGIPETGTCDRGYNENGDCITGDSGQPAGGC